MKESTGIDLSAVIAGFAGGRAAAQPEKAPEERPVVEL